MFLSAHMIFNCVRWKKKTILYKEPPFGLIYQNKVGLQNKFCQFTSKFSLAIISFLMVYLKKKEKKKN